jgi:molybdopterin synthase catalytic subunit
MDFSFTYEHIRIEDHVERVKSEDCGGISTFIGTVRNSFQGRKVLYLEYTAYAKMAEKEVKKIFDEVVERWNRIKFISVQHRLGKVPAGEASVVIACSSPDRISCLQAVPYIIESIKSRVPIWKKEFGEDWSEWKANIEWDPIKIN